MSLVWTKTSAPSTNMYWTWVASSTSGQYLAATASAVPASAGGIWISGDFGTTWAQSNAPPNPGGGGWTRIASNAAGDKMIAAVYGGLIYRSTNYGLDWSSLNTGTGNAYWDGLASDNTGQYLVAIEHLVGIFNSNDSGLSWFHTETASLNWSCITSDNTGQKLAAGAKDESQLYASSNGQAGATVTWTPQNGSEVTSVAFWCMTCDSTGTYLAAAPGTVNKTGYIWTSNNSGTSWSHCTTSGSQKWTSITSSSDGANLAATTSAGIYISTTGTNVPAAPGAAIWSLSNNLNINWTSVASDSAGTNLVAVTNGNGIYSTHVALRPRAYVAYGNDLTGIFDSTNPTGTPPTYYYQDGFELNTIYTPLTSIAASPTGFLVVGADLNTKFEKHA